MVACSVVAVPAYAEDGYDLWLRYAPLEGEAQSDLRADSPFANIADGGRSSPTLEIALEELSRGFAGLQGSGARAANGSPVKVELDCGETVGTGEGGYRLSPVADDPRRAFLIAAEDHLGCLYGSFALLRELSTGKRLSDIAIGQAPAMPLRMLNHWDNPDGHVERGYAGRSIFDWWHLPERLDQRMIDYARANASLGINGVVVNNVNAKSFMLEPRYIAKLERLAHAWRPYGIRVYLSARFSAPRDIGGLDTADPLDPAVRAWWHAKADQIYTAIPDFGGFLVKANSEGQPGPQDYGRTHADGANMLAAAIGDRGTVIWRAFVYSAEDEADRAKQAYEEFVPLDGQFADNVIVQVKNGPVDFQPREPFHPMFGAMPNTRLMLEAQITKEYLGFASHLAYLAPLWKEVLDADTGRGGTVAEVVAPVGIAGVANTGSDRNWTGSHFDQANWYAFGRLAWNPALTSEEIAGEWAAQTFTRDPAAVGAITSMMLDSREAVVSYMTPLGLAHQMDTGHHYGPGPWVCDLARPEWNPCYYHQADRSGIGFDRTANGSDALSQYAPQVAAQWADPATIDPHYLLWFHHVAWDDTLPSGRTVWQELVREYDRGVAAVDTMAGQWAGLRGAIDAERHRAVSESLAIQQREARWWRDASVAYWQSLNGLEMPQGASPPAETLEAYKSRSFPEAPGQ
ncbi:alpha-glucuronidase [Qipengyuania sp. GH1]|uniref:alpha-glucuronidase family glycosyl hydrolase n=1 Tax=Qipengyuania aestuarii TaxID=2867241 RepID=UPI001C88BC25|nr:alpha-glucuronidase family glycosyl hydrolase [Qipengyuania aestuarii]MBX7534953.1 alpha-glucuronidase [Qipengyuania aestuarii]